MTKQLINHTTKMSPPAFRPLATGLLQRACACGKHTGNGGECQECRRHRETTLQRSAIDPSPLVGASPSGYASSIAGREHDFSAVPIKFQAKLTMSEPGDHFEQEADRVADAVVRGGGYSVHGRFGDSNSPVQVGSYAQRQESTAEEEEEDGGGEDHYEDHDKDHEEDGGDEENGESELTPDETGMPKLEVSAPTAGRRISVTLSPGTGRPLGNSIRAFMEQRIGYDFSHVRIHTDAQAIEASSRLRAYAFTVGSDIYFNRGRYSPEGYDGQKLLAHELTHVVQQTGQIRSVGSPLRAAIQCQRQPRRRKTRSVKLPCNLRSQDCHGKAAKKRCGPNSCDGECSPHVSNIIHSPCCGNETCGGSSASNTSNSIRHLDVNLTSQMVTAEWGNTKSITSIRPNIPSSPNPSATPQGSFTVGQKCGPCHTNRCGDGMGWFTGFHNGLMFGFHNSQDVGNGIHSHGCVRLFCDMAKIVHDNTTSGTTTVCVHKGKGWGCNHKPLLPPSSPKPRPARPQDSAPPRTGPAVSMTESPEDNIGSEEETV